MWSMVGLVVLANLVLLGVLGFGLRRSVGVASIFQRGVRGPAPPQPLASFARGISQQCVRARAAQAQ